ncbi:hypothetical protein SBY92_003846 [Candida maltosa Xu316]
MGLFGGKKKESSRRSSTSSGSKSSTAFSQFDEKQEYLKRCSSKSKDKKKAPQCVSFSIKK